MLTGYLASHFFNDAMFRWTEDLAVLLEKETGIKLYVPQRNDSINDKKNNDDTIDSIKISKADTEELKKANILIASIDGLSIDDGVAGEIMAFGVMNEIENDEMLNSSIPRLIIGVMTDMRWLGTGENKLYRNQMIIGKIKEHGSLVVGYPGDESYKEEIIKIINEFKEKYSL